MIRLRSEAILTTVEAMAIQDTYDLPSADDAALEYFEQAEILMEQCDAYQAGSRFVKHSDKLDADLYFHPVLDFYEMRFSAPTARYALDYAFLLSPTETITTQEFAKRIVEYFSLANRRNLIVYHYLMGMKNLMVQRHYDNIRYIEIKK